MEIEKFLNEKYIFKYNEVLGRTLYKDKNGNKEFKLLEDYKLNSIYRELKNNGISTSVQGLKSLLLSDYVPKFDPFKEYFQNVPQWDGHTDYILKLSKMVKTTDDELFQWAFKKWMVAFVACAIEEESTNHSVLILTGKQGSGKTTWLTNLVPSQLKEYCYSGKIKPDNKDSNILLSERILINMDEWASYTKNQVEAFKELITKDTVSERRAYGYFTENYVRRASFVGSSNHKDILIDVTGNRRFLVFESLDIDYLRKVNMDNVYSQALSLLKQGFKYFFDMEDIIKIEANNEQFKQTNIEEEYFEKYFRKPTANEIETISKMNASEIISYIKVRANTQLSLNAISFGKLIKSKGFQTMKVDGLNKYLVVIKK
jgi:predicted P-loop ATPase